MSCVRSELLRVMDGPVPERETTHNPTPLFAETDEEEAEMGHAVSLNEAKVQAPRQIHKCEGPLNGFGVTHCNRSREGRQSYGSVLEVFRMDDRGLDFLASRPR